MRTAFIKERSSDTDNPRLTVLYMMSLRASARTDLGARIISCTLERSFMFIMFILSNSRVSRAGRDAARAFGTGCFATHHTHDLRGLDEQEMQVRILLLDEFTGN